MRRIVIPEYVVKAAIYNPTAKCGPGGVALHFPVQVNWPELRLTEQQVFENAVCRANGYPPPHDDNSIVVVELPVVLL